MTPFGQTRGGATVHRIGLESAALRVSVLTLGACLQDVRLAGWGPSLTLGADTLAPYEGAFYHLGTVMGPVANRISGARAVIAGQEHRFDRNFLGAHTLHGGSAALHGKVWQVTDHDTASVTLSIDLPDGERGFPGTRHIEARFSVDGATLRLALTATTDAPTLMNLANHSYWTLGDGPTTAGHVLQVAADRYLPADPETCLPSGEIASVEGTRFDYRAGRALEGGAEGLLDVNFCLSDRRQPLREVARLTGPSGLEMRMSSTEPGLQVFDGHILQPPYAGLALEAQFWPDAPTQSAFPDITLHPGETWRQETCWSFAASR